MRIWYVNHEYESGMRIFDAIIEFDPAKPQFYPYLKLTKQPSPHSAIILHFNGTYSEVMHEELASNRTDNPRNLFTMSVEMPILD